MWHQASLDGEGLEVPDFLGVFLDGAVAGELAGGGDVHEGGLVPGVLVAVEDLDAVLGLDEVGQVLEEHVVVVVVQEVLEEGLEDARGHEGEDVAADRP